jgi:hypothetical protein
MASLPSRRDDALAESKVVQDKEDIEVNMAKTR